ncbi:MAG: hypothetical protein ACRDHZ_26490, partial [Ktedonobacteraceae bacterium]
MQEVPAKTSTVLRILQDSAQWYQATTLSERIALLQKNASIPSEQTLGRVTDAQVEKRQPSHEAQPSPTSAERATQRFKQWKGQLPFHRSEQSFAQRLAVEALTEEDLFTLLAQPAEAIQAAFDETPIWLTHLLSAFEHQDTSSLPIQHIADAHTQAVYHTIQPLFAKGFERLQTGIAKLQASYTRLPFDPQNISLLLFPHIFEQIMAKFTKTLVLELNVARVQGRLRGETPEQRFDYFLQQLAQPEQMLTLLEEYPVLARQMVEMIERWVICELEFLHYLCADWDEL